MTSTTTSPLTIRHNRFLLNGRPFLFRGVVYQEPVDRSRKARIRPSELPPRERHADRDPLNDTRLDDLKRDIELFIELGINAIWVYTVCTGASHDASMRLLQENGIYVFVGCSAPGSGECINRRAPRDSYTKPLLERFYAVVDAFGDYDNVAGFCVANSIVNSPATTVGAEVIKAVVRDVKSYVALRARDYGSRRVPVGLTDEKWASMETPSLEYYIAGSKDDQVDFYGLVHFDDGPDLFQRQTRRAPLAKRFTESEVPVVVSEYGSNLSRPRHFSEARDIYGKTGRDVFSGGFAYQFFEAPNRYGLVIQEEDTLRKLEDFHQLRLRLKETEGVEEELIDPTTSIEARDGVDCPYPGQSDGIWEATADIPQCPWSASEYLHLWQAGS